MSSIKQERVVHALNHLTGKQITFSMSGFGVDIDGCLRSNALTPSNQAIIRIPFRLILSIVITFKNPGKYVQVYLSPGWALNY